MRLYTPDGQERRESEVQHDGFGDRLFAWGYPRLGETEVFTSLFGDSDISSVERLGGNLDCLAGTYRIVLGDFSPQDDELIEALVDETFILG